MPYASVNIKLKDIIEKLKDVEAISYPNIDSIVTAAGAPTYLLDSYCPEWEEKFESRFTEKAIYSWYCTDTWVGFFLYYFDDEPVVMTYQAGRKYDREIHWIHAPSMGIDRATNMKKIRDAAWEFHEGWESDEPENVHLETAIEIHDRGIGPLFVDNVGVHREH